MIQSAPGNGRVSHPVVPPGLRIHVIPLSKPISYLIIGLDLELFQATDDGTPVHLGIAYIHSGVMGRVEDHRHL